MSLLPSHKPILASPRLAPAGAEPTDEELLVRLRGSDATALDIVLRRHWGAVVAYQLRMLGSHDAAEDIAQRTFCQLWDRRTSWRDHGSLRGLLYRIARNFAVSEQRRSEAETRSHGVHVLAQSGIPTPLGLLQDQQLRESLSAAIQELPRRRREAFVLRYIHELSYQEIAGIMGTSPQTAANQVSHALAALRHSLAGELQG